MINEKVKAVVKIILPMIFILYTCSITFFTHTHIVDGVTIVHSHPYKSDDSGNPAHEHTGAEIQLIHTLSTFYSTALIVFSVILGIFTVKKVVLQIRTYLFRQQTHVEGLSRLRPPPVL